MELFDVVDKNGIPTGEVVERSVAHRDGIRHRAAHVWIVREHEGKTQVLLQKRSMNKDSFPGQYDTSSAGHIHAGDEPLESALRELEEELGIYADARDMQFIGCFDVGYERVFGGKVFRDNECSFVYVYTGEVDEEKLILQEEEVAGVCWFDVDFLDRALASPRDERFCVPTKGYALIREWISGICK